MNSSIKSMNVRAPGPGGITVPDFKNMGQYARNFILNHSLHTGIMLNYHRLNKTILIRKGNQDKTNNIKGIYMVAKPPCSI